MQPADKPPVDNEYPKNMKRCLDLGIFHNDDITGIILLIINVFNSRNETEIDLLVFTDDINFIFLKLGNESSSKKGAAYDEDVSDDDNDTVLKTMNKKKKHASSR